jgi:ribosomal protein S27AE
MRLSIRQAVKNKERWFDALAAFANLGDSQADWDKLRLMHPEMFGELWLLSGSEEYAIGSFDDDPSHVYSLRSEVAKAFLSRRLRYRDCLRSVWSDNDRDGKNLRILYGFDLMEEEAIMGGSNAPEPLPPGKPIVDGRTGEIIWEFPSDFQQALYELMKSRRKAKTCPQCGRYFFADKPAQAYCSTGCAGNAKRATALEYFNREGRAKRLQRRKKEKRNDL